MLKDKLPPFSRISKKATKANIINLPDLSQIHFWRFLRQGKYYYFSQLLLANYSFIDTPQQGDGT